MIGHSSELRLATGTTPSPAATVDLITAARRSLAEARTLPDIRSVMEMASAAAEAGRRAARLAEAHRLAADVVEAANEAANDAAAIRIEAQAKAGELLQQMSESGERKRAGQTYQPGTSLQDLGVSRNESSRWQQVAAVPEGDRQTYVEETKTAQGEVSTAGLLRHAETRAERASGTDDERLATELRRVLERLLTYPPSLLAGVDGLELPRYVKLVRRTETWLSDAQAELAARPWTTRPPVHDGEVQEDQGQRWIGRGLGWVIDGDSADSASGESMVGNIGEWSRQRVAGRWVWRADDRWQAEDNRPYWTIEEPPEGRRDRNEAAAHRRWLEREHPDRAGDWELWYSASGSWLCQSFHASLEQAQAAAAVVASDRDRMAELNAGRSFREPAAARPRQQPDGQSTDLDGEEEGAADA
jgi:hypothetical protein